jgi:hypothetical protein
MSLLARCGIAFALAAAMAFPTWAAETAAPNVAPELVAFASDEGLARLSRADAKADFPALANQFEAQSNSAFCGPATAAIVLNAVRGRSPDLPRDRSRLRADDLKYIADAFDPTIPRFTQDNVITRGLKTRAQVLGEPVNINGKQVADFGYQARQFDELLRANELQTRLVIADEKTSNEEIRSALVENLKRRGDYVVVNYSRRAVGQQGGGHISPLGAYDAESDSFLVLDVNPASAGWVWMPTSTLIEGMRTFDTVENRGYVVVERR